MYLSRAGLKLKINLTRGHLILQSLTLHEFVVKVIYIVLKRFHLIFDVINNINKKSLSQDENK